MLNMNNWNKNIIVTVLLDSAFGIWQEDFLMYFNDMIIYMLENLMPFEQIYISVLSYL